MLLDIFYHLCISMVFVADELSPLGLKVLIPFAAFETHLPAPNIRHFRIPFLPLSTFLYVISHSCISIISVADKLSSL
jgi:hypothetical protein